MATLMMTLGFKCRICSYIWRQSVKMATERIDDEHLGVSPPDNVECPECGCDAGDVCGGLSDDVLAEA